MKGASNNDSKLYINHGEEDQMEICGYKHNVLKTAVTRTFYILTLGLLRLFFHWYPKLLLISTHSICELSQAQKVLITDDYKGKYKTYFVETIRELSPADAANNNSFEKLVFYLCDGLIREVESVKIFDCKRTRYVWDGQNTFIKLCGLERGILQSDFHKYRGFSESEQSSRAVIYGRNEIDVPIQSILKLFILEALTPFYIFQIFSLIVWLSEEYYYYGIAIVIMSVFGIGSSIVQTRKNQSNLRGTLHLMDTINICRDHSYVDLPTTDLVPGDVIVIPSHGCIMHCDAVLLNGSCIVNESMLTGESVPVLKTSLPNVDKPFDVKDNGDHVLYCGTKVIQTRYYGNEKVLAVVVRTGFLTSKGQLVRSIMYPPPADFKFDKDSYKFMIILAVVASIGVIYTIVSKSTRNIAFGDIIIKALDTITIVIPPALPAAMTVGKLYALNRLKTKDIFCINSRIINVSGSVNCVCFDKTGTLTEDGLDMWGVVPIREGSLQNPTKTISSLPITSELIHGMATCHSLTLIDGKLEGDPLDVKMFESTEWLLEEPQVQDISKFDLLVPTVVKPTNSALEIAIIHQNQFSSKLQRMSVVTKTLNSPNFQLFCKGSPEMIASLCKQSTLPKNLTAVLRTYTEKGFRVIALGMKELVGMNLVRIQKTQREDVECDLNFLGLVVLENKLKPQTGDVIETLMESKMKVVMITGDNIETALSVAKDCGIIKTGSLVVNVEACPPTMTQDVKLSFNVSQLLVPKDDYIVDIENAPKNINLAMTGTTWAIIREYFPKDLAKFVAKGTVFARMSSDQKQQLVEELQILGYYVSMCGDGTNDCGALKAAHVGISLSEAESSIASPFTSRNANIGCVPEIVKQGRAALVTSFGIFKFMVAYSMTEFLSVIILYGIDSNLTSLQFLYIDICLVVVTAAVFGRTDAYGGKLIDKPPLTSLLSFVPLASLILQILCVVSFQIIAYHGIQTFEWFQPFVFVPGTNIYTSYENYAVFATSIFQYITLAIVYSKGKPYRKPIYTNIVFSICIIVMLALCIYIIYDPADWILTGLEMKIPPQNDGKIMILLLAAVHFVFAYIVEDLVCDYLLQTKVKSKFKESSRKKYLHVDIDIETLAQKSLGVVNGAFEK